MLMYIEIWGHAISTYNFWNAISALVTFFYLICQSKKYCSYSYYANQQPTEKRKDLVSFGEVLVIIVIAFALFRVLNPAFGDWFTHGNANYFGSLTAWFVSITVMTIIFKANPLRSHDLFAPALPLQLFFAKIACLFHGCCSGFVVPNSWYFNQCTNRYEFPVQMVEAIVALMLFFFLRWYQKKSIIPGSLFPIYLIIYSFSRFLTEFLRADFPNIFGPFDAYQVMSVFFLLFGGFLFYFVWVYKDVKNQHQKKRKR